ncbi:MAG: MATE family efflux transporter [Paludibacteraceae bacterium]|nr:MATE family efflux transporter [Paludibacteraceae bacterium]
MATLSEYIPYYKRNLKVAFPVMLTQFGASLVGLVDSIMVGHYATADLAAVSFSNAIFFTIMVFSMGALMGLTPLVGYEVGKAPSHAGDDSTTAIANLFHSGILFTLILSTAMILLLGTCIPLLGYFGQEESVVIAARPYYTFIVISIVPFLFFCLQRQFLEGLGNTMVAMIITMGMNLLNILLNWVFIFGHWGSPAMGATGAGIATLISRTLMPFLFWIVIRSKTEWRPYIQHAVLNAHQSTIRDNLRRLWHIGAPIGGQTVLETTLFTLSFVIVGWLSKEALAAHQIANQIADLTFMLALGIGAATTIRVSHQLGKGDIYAVKMAANASIHLVLVMNTIGAILMISLRNYIPMLFTEDPEVIRIGSTLVMIAGFFQYADGLQSVGAAMLRGITDVRRPMLYAFIAYIAISLPLGLLLMFPCHMGAPGMWISFIVGLSTAALLFHIRFRKQIRTMEKELPSNGI